MAVNGDTGGVSSSCHPRIFEGKRDNGIDVLPVEILSHIFILGSDVSNGEDQDVACSTISSRVHFATLCSHVCNYWRHVAIGTPQLWACIRFREGLPFEKYGEWIARSKAVPLTLEIQHTAPDLDGWLAGQQLSRFKSQVFDEVERVYSMILPHAHRWRSLKVNAVRYEFIWFWLGYLALCPATPNLEYLSFSCREHPHEGEHVFPAGLSSPRTILPNTLKLNDVVLRGVHINWDAAKWLKDLRSLSLIYRGKDAGPSVDQFARVLDRSPYIEDLTLYGWAPAPGKFPYQRITLNCLRVLSIIDVAVAIAVEIVEHVEFPALKILTLGLDEGSNAEPLVSAVCGINHARFRGVEVLTLTSFSCTRQTTTRFLESMPKLSSMTLDFTRLPLHFYHALVHKCPEANTLKLSGLVDKKLRWLIATRQLDRGMTPIRRLYLDQDDVFEEDTIRWLKENVGQLEFYEPEHDDDDQCGDDDGEWAR